MNRTIQTYLVLLISISCLISACSIEKRHYMRGYHVTFFSNQKAIPSLQAQACSTTEADLNPSIQDSTSEIQVDPPPSIRSTAESNCVTQKLEVGTKLDSRKQTLSTKSQVNVREAESIDSPAKTNAQVHPAAAGSLLFGILSALCFVGMFISSFNPLGLVIALVVGLLAFAFLAKKLSKRAFDDMHYARNRYSGRGLAAAGLALSVITVVALIGLLAVIVFGIAFTSIS